MEALEKGKAKLGEICDILKKETLEPAQNEAKSIVDSAKNESGQIIEKAHAEAKQILDAAMAKIDQERKLFENSMDLASKQTFDELRQRVEQHLFGIEISKLSQEMIQSHELISKLIATIANAIEKEGLAANLSFALSSSIQPEEISKHLVKEIAEKLKGGEIKVESIESGAVIKVAEDNLKIEVSEQSIKELMGSFLRESFREILFKNC